MYIKCKFVFLFPNKTFYSNSANLDEFTDLGEKCLESKCGKENKTSFNWCYTDSRPANVSANFSGSWDYCTPRSGFLISFTFFFKTIYSALAILVFQYDLSVIWQSFYLVKIKSCHHEKITHRFAKNFFHHMNTPLFDNIFFDFV